MIGARGFLLPFRIAPEALKPQNNNFTLVRLVLASAVILTHCYWQQTGLYEVDWLSPWLGAAASRFAVDGFFFLSGFLVFRSLNRRGSIGKFLLARLARMYPALAVSVLGATLIGLALTTVGPQAYFSGDTLRFVFGNLSFVQAHFSLTGVTCGADLCNVNGSLWTLQWEMRCYLLLALLGFLGLTGRRGMALLVVPGTLVFFAAWQFPAVQAALHDHVPRAVFWADRIARLWPLFAMGCAAALWHERIPLHGGVFVLLLLGNAAVAGTGFADAVRLVLIAYGVLYCGFRPSRWTGAIARWPDYSYGIYIYAFPVMTVLGQVFPRASPATLALLNLAAVLPLAALSWHFVEKPVLDAFRRRARKSGDAPDRAFEPLAQGRAAEPASG